MQLTKINKFITFCALFATMGINVALAQVTVKDAQGNNFIYQGEGKRVVVLEFSFADALANIDVKAVGIADDGNSNRLIPIVAQKQAGYTSVGTRAQPSLEEIAALKPDLIIADVNRHAAILPQLQQIAPTILLNSLYETYDQDIENARTIAALVHKSDVFDKRLVQYQEQMAAYAKQAQANGLLATFNTSRDKRFEVYTGQTYQGGVLKALGYKVLDNDLQSATGRYDASLEQVVNLQPQVMFIANYVPDSISNVVWSKNPLWQVIPAVKNNRVYAVDSNLWARARGMYASELMAQEIVKVTSAKK
ncbi:ABC transporter substrate-binding protein [Psittacicella gerlachiana]|uniref:Fe/B12 periplasmic-binding domain-containing protein n=1 Tax=Psittacicella gerlachiana TaxID=2028574 RepID=A0A3A1YFG7_9GAMM|nr:Fe(3+) dicitrate ABC transporter substrate-binding protein [Psittacicella gerlachiana]RIY36415.1 hypothetical protein CKF59_02780 [Psittacicella gerlachiana]